MKANLFALHNVYSGETYEYAREANYAFDARTRSADALTSLLVERASQAEGTTEDTDTAYSEPWGELALEASNLAQANENFDFFVSMAASVTPSREQLGETLLVNPTDVNAQPPIYYGAPGL